MKRILIAIAILVCTFLAASMITSAYSWSHIIGGGLSGTTGVPLKVDTDGMLYLID